MTPDMFRNVRIKITSVPIPDSYELSVTMARGKPHHLWYRDLDAVSALMPTPTPTVPGRAESSVLNKMRLWFPYSEDCKLISWD